MSKLQERMHQCRDCGEWHPYWAEYSIGIPATPPASAYEQDAGVCPTCGKRTCIGRLQYEDCATPPASETVEADLKECGICGDYTVGGIEVHEACLDDVVLRRVARAEADERVRALREVATIVRRHTHQGLYAMTAYAGPHPESDCLLCRALVAAGVLTLDEIGAGTRAALDAAPEDAHKP